MPPKKHLDGQGRRRNHCRRAVQLSEFLRGDDEPTVQAQAPVPPTDSQGTTESSIGTIPPTDRSASCVTVTPVVTPDTTTDEPEKVSLQEETPPPPPPVNVWQLSSGEKDRPQGTFVPDDKAFPGLGKQGKKFKPLVFPEASRATRSPDSAKARRVCPVLGNFLPESLFPDKNRTVARWLSSVRSAQDTKPASGSPSPLKRATPQQPESPGCSSEHNLPTSPVIGPHKPASRVAVAAAASVPPLEKGLSQRKQAQKSPKNSNKNEQQQQSSKQKMPENAAAAAARETKAFEEKDCVAASQFSAQNLCGTPSFWEESDDSLAEEEQPVAQQGERETIRHRSSLNANAQEFRPMAREEEEREMEPEPEPEQLPETRIKRRRHSQRYIRAMKRRQHLNWNQLFEKQIPVRLSGGQRQAQSQASIALPGGCYYSAPPAAGHQQQASPVYEAPPATPTFSGASSTTPVHVPSAAFASSSQIPPRRQNNANDVGQSVFRISCLPSTGVGTKAPSDIPSLNQLPSSISGASRFSHTLSSLPPPVEEEEEENYPGNCRRQRSIISPDLFYNRSLLDMDREDTQEEQEEEEEQASPRDREIETEREEPREQPRHADAVVVAPAAREPIFRSPSSHGEGYPQPDLNCVPANIKKLHKTITERYSDYAFVYALGAQLGQECVPMDCYVYLKMILLASIVSIEPDELRPPISLCIISTDSLMANRLMNCIGQLAPRFLGPHEYGLQPTIAGGELSSSRYSWVVASPLLLAQQGVYYAGDWTRLSKEQTEQIEKCIENGSVPVPQLQNDQALEAAIWTHWQPENSSNQTLAFAKLCPIFGLPIYMGEAAGSSSSSDSLWSFLLRQHSEPESEPDGQQPDGLNIPEEDVRMLLHLLHQRQVTFEDKAQHMLQKYYVISRKERPNVFTSKTYIVLKQFSESFAKLALRLEVLESDVCLAIFHCEHFVQQIFGGTSPPPPAVNSFGIISRIDPYMNVFGRWLLQYLDRYDDQELGMHKAKRRRTVSWEFL